MNQAIDYIAVALVFFILGAVSSVFTTIYTIKKFIQWMEEF